jgi:hypothetical protein
MTELERFFFSTVSVTVPLIEAVWEYEAVATARIKLIPAMNFLIVMVAG